MGVGTEGCRLTFASGTVSENKQEEGSFCKGTEIYIFADLFLMVCGGLETLRLPRCPVYKPQDSEVTNKTEVSRN